MTSVGARIVVAEPTEQLKDIVETFWQVESPGRATLRCLPTGRMDLVYVLDGEIGYGSSLPPFGKGQVILAGGFERATLLHLREGSRIFGLRFRLGSPGLRLLAGPRPSAGNWIDLSATCPETWKWFDFRNRLNGQADFAARIAVVERGLLEQAAHELSCDAGLPVLAVHPGQAAKDLRLRLMRQLRRDTKLATGLTPKKLQMLDRFGTAKRLIEEDEMELSEVALAAGYCDQAHLNREFIRMSGVPPLKHRNRRNVGFFSLELESSQAPRRKPTGGPELAGRS